MTNGRKLIAVTALAVLLSVVIMSSGGGTSEVDGTTTTENQYIYYTVVDGQRVTHIGDIPGNSITVTSSITTWSGGQYYVVDGTVRISGSVTVSGEAHLILKDGSSLDVTQGIRVNSGNTLHIYAQGEGTGALTATGSGRCAGIGGEGDKSCGTIHIHGGIIKATGGQTPTMSSSSNRYDCGAGIGGGDNGPNGGTVYIYDGNVTASGRYGGYGYPSAGIGGGGSTNDRGSGSNLYIYGGNVTANGGSRYNSGADAYGIGRGGGDSYIFAGSGSLHILGSGTAIVDANSIGATGQSANWKGIVYNGNSGRVYNEATLAGDHTMPHNLTVPEGTTLTIPAGVTLTIPSNLTLTVNGEIINNGTIVANGRLVGTGTISGTGSVDMTAPGAPSLGSVTATSITVSTTAERMYICTTSPETPAINSEGWVQGTGSDHTFDGLTPATQYYIWTYVAKTTLHGDSDVSPASTRYTLHPTPEAGAGYTVDYVNETASPLEGYEIRAGTSGNFTKTGGSVRISPGGTLQVRLAATSNGPGASDVCSNTMDARPSAPGIPAIDFVGEGVTGTSGLEYRVGTSGDWTACQGSVSLSDAGWTGTAMTMQFRTMATASSAGSDGCFASEPVSLSVPARKDLSLSVDNHDEGVIVPSGHRYSLTGPDMDGTWLQGDGSLVKLSPESYMYVYAEAVASGTDAAFRSNVQTIQAPSRGTAPSGFTFDYADETVSCTAAWEYKDMTGSWVTSEGDVLLSDLGWNGNGMTAQVRTPATEALYASEDPGLAIDPRPAAPSPNVTHPSFEDTSDGSISGLNPNTNYEYRVGSGTVWTAVTSDSEGSISGLPQGTYALRLQSTVTTFAGFPAENVELKGTVRTYILSADGIAFDRFTYGDAPPEARTLSISNSGNSDATITSIQIDGSSFILEGSGYTVPANGGISSWTVRPAESLHAGEHSSTVTITYNGGTTATARVSLTVDLRPIDITGVSTDPSEGTAFGSETVTATVSGTAGNGVPSGTVVFTATDGTDRLTIGSAAMDTDHTASVTWTNLQGGDWTISAAYSPAEGDDHSAGEGASKDFAVNRIDQTGFGFDSPSIKVTYSPSGTFAFSVSGGQSENPVVLTVKSGSDVIGIVGGSFTSLKSGNAVVTATKEGDRNYNKITAEVTVTVERGAGRVVISCGDVTYGETPTPNIISISDTDAVVTYTYRGTGNTQYGPSSEAPSDSGTYSVTAAAGRTDRYLGCESNLVGFTISKADVTIVSVSASSISHGQALSASILSNGSAVSVVTGTEVPGTFAWDDGTITPSSGNSSFKVIFTPADKDNYNGAETTVTVSIVKTVPVISEPVPSAITYGMSLSESALADGGASSPVTGAEVPGTFTWADGSTVPHVADSGTTPYTVVFTPSDTSNYTTVTFTVTVTVEPASITGTVTVSGDTVFGRTLTASYDGNAGSSVAYQWQRTTATGWEDIDGAVSAGYTVTVDDVGSVLRVVVIGVGDYTGEIVVSTDSEVLKADADALAEGAGFTIDYEGEVIFLDDGCILYTSESDGELFSDTSLTSMLDSGGKLWICLGETETHYESPRTEIVLQRQEVPAVPVDFVAETIPTLPTMEYLSIEGAWTVCSEDMDVSSEGFGWDGTSATEVAFRMKAVAGEYGEGLFASPVTTATIPARPALEMPAVDFHGETIVGVDGLECLTDGWLDFSSGTSITGFGWDGYTDIVVTFRVKAVAGESFASLTDDLTIPARPGAPKELALDNTAESIVIPEGMMYNLSSPDYGSEGWTAGDGGAVTILPEQSIHAYIVSSDSGFKSHVTTITAPARASQPVVGIDFLAETLSTDTTMEWSADGSIWAACEGNMDAAAFGWDGTSDTGVMFRTAATGSMYASEPQHLTIPTRPETPVVSHITATETTVELVTQYPSHVLEVSLAGVEWIDGAFIDGLGPNGEYTVDVRVKSTDSSFRSETVEKTIWTMPHVIEVDIAEPSAESPGTVTVTDIHWEEVHSTGSLTVTVPSYIGDYDLVVDEETLQELVDHGLGLTVSRGDGITAAYDADAVKGMLGSVETEEGETPTISLSATPVADDSFSISITVTVYDKTGSMVHMSEMSAFGGSVTVSFAYTLTGNLTPRTVAVFHVDDRGERELMDTWYDEAAGILSFRTTHHSDYVIDRHMEIPPFITDEDDPVIVPPVIVPPVDIETDAETGDDTTAVLACAAAAVVAALMAVFLIVDRRRR